MALGIRLLFFASHQQTRNQSLGTAESLEGRSSPSKTPPNKPQQNSLCISAETKRPASANMNVRLLVSPPLPVSPQEARSQPGSGTSVVRSPLGGLTKDFLLRLRWPPSPAGPFSWSLCSSGCASAGGGDAGPPWSAASASRSGRST